MSIIAEKTFEAVKTLPESLVELCEVAPVDASTIRDAIRLVRRYKLSHWDSLIVAAALLAGCEKLYSQDMQNGQVFDEQLKGKILKYHYRKSYSIYGVLVP